LPGASIVTRPLSQLEFSGDRKITRQRPHRDRRVLADEVTPSPN
jgi:hypothetical protein